MSETQTTRDPHFLSSLWQELRLMWRLLRDPAVPFYLKLIPLAAGLYLLFPLDLVPDGILALGQADDLTALFIGMKTFINLVPPHLVARHRVALQGGVASDAAGGDIIEGEWQAATDVPPSDKEVAEQIKLHPDKDRS